MRSLRDILGLAWYLATGFSRHVKGQPEEMREWRVQEQADWATKMVAEYGPDVCKWPTLGCGGRFRPWKKGESMVCEVKDTDGTWSAFIAARPSLFVLGHVA